MFRGVLRLGVEGGLGTGLGFRGLGLAVFRGFYCKVWGLGFRVYWI